MFCTCYSISQTQSPKENWHCIQATAIKTQYSLCYSSTGSIKKKGLQDLINLASGYKSTKQRVSSKHMLTSIRTLFIKHLHYRKLQSYVFTIVWVRFISLHVLGSGDLLHTNKVVTKCFTQQTLSFNGLVKLFLFNCQLTKVFYGRIARMGVLQQTVNSNETHLSNLTYSILYVYIQDSPNLERLAS